MTLHLDKSKIIHLYTVEKKSAAQIAVEVGASPPCILNRLKKWNIPIRSASEGKIRRDLDGAIDDIVSRYSEDKQTLNEIANIYKVTAPAIRKRLVDAGVQIRPNGGQVNRKFQYIASLDPRDIEKVYNLGKPLFETAVHLGISVPTLRRILKKNGIRIRSQSEQRLLGRSGHESRAQNRSQKVRVDVPIPDGTFAERVKHLRENENLRIDQIAEVLGAERLDVYQCMNA